MKQELVLVFTAFMTVQVWAQDARRGDPAVFNVTDFGARTDGSALATDAFRAAVAAAHKAGGGTVYVPAGHYITGPIEMVSNLTLEFDAGAIVRFPAMKLPLVPGRQQGIEVWNRFTNARLLER